MLITRKAARLLSLVVLMQLCCLVASAQARITGQVKDKNGAGVPNITVQMRNTSVGTVTDGNGNFVLSGDVPSGQQVLEFSGVGYKIKSVAVDVSGDKAITVNTDLESDVMGLEEVVVTGDVCGHTLVIEPQPLAAAFKLLRYICGVPLAELLGYRHPLVHPLYALQLFGHLLPHPKLLAMGFVVE